MERPNDLCHVASGLPLALNITASFEISTSPFPFVTFPFLIKCKFKAGATFLSRTFVKLLAHPVRTGQARQGFPGTQWRARREQRKFHSSGAPSCLSTGASVISSE